MDSRFLAFAAVATLLVVTPGAALAVIMKNTLLAGRRAGLWTIAGLATAVLGHAAASMVGISAILARSATAFTVVKLLGAAYLIWLGVHTLWHSGRDAAPPSASGGRPPAAPDGGDRGGRAAVFYRSGWLTNLLNPKPALFYLAVLPQFIEPGEPVIATSLVLAAIHLAILLGWYSLCVYLVAGVSVVLRRPTVRRTLDQLLGAILVVLGVRVAL